MLIVIGDPLVLSLDPLWRSFLNYVYREGGWTGPDISWDPKAPVDAAGGYDKAIRQATDQFMVGFTQHMQILTPNEVEDEVDANVDRPWRELE
jgi:helicase MOV-10